MCDAGLGMGSGQRVELEDDRLGDGTRPLDGLLPVAAANDSVARALQAINELAEGVTGPARDADIEDSGEPAGRVQTTDGTDHARLRDEQFIYAAALVAHMQVGLITGQQPRALAHHRD